MCDNELEKARQEIAEIDRNMAALFLRRMEAAKPIAAHKAAHGLPIFDKAREDRLIAANLAGLCEADESIRNYYVSFQKEVMNLSKQYQNLLMGNMRVAYSGTAGAFARIAAEKIFPGTVYVAQKDFTDAYRCVENGNCDVAVIPYENSSAGEVAPVWDLLFSGTLYISGMYDMAVRHDLLVLPGTALSEVKTVVSHPQALAQCDEFIKRKGLKTMEYANTAKAAEYVALSGDRSMAAIASAECAALFNLEVVADGINESANNTTRFAVLSRTRNIRKDPGNTGLFVLMFTVRNEAGALAHAVSIIGKYGFNMISLRSRPMRQLLWQYYFCIECEGSIDTEQGRRMMEELAATCDRLKLVGSYTKN